MTLDRQEDRSRQASVRKGGKEGAYPQAHLSPTNASSYFGEWGCVMLAKGVERPAWGKAVTSAIQRWEPCQTLSHLQRGLPLPEALGWAGTGQVLVSTQQLCAVFPQPSHSVSICPSCSFCLGRPLHFSPPRKVLPMLRGEV